MTETEISIVEAAWQMFARYGFKKTTMGDIAEQAGVARQTVYNAFPGKAEILRAVVKHAADVSLQKVRVAWDEDSDLASKLSSFIRLGPLEWYDAIMAAPDNADLLEGMGDKTTEEWQAVNAAWLAALGAQFEADGAQSIDPGMALEDVVELFYWTSMNAKYGARDREHLVRRLIAARAATLALIGRPAGTGGL